MINNQWLADLTATVVTGLQDVLTEVKQDRVLVHCDATTNMAASLAAFYQKVPVGHVEAGLRTHNIYSPWPEEINLQITSRITITALSFAPTKLSQQSLLDKKTSENSITGNTVIDALLSVVDKIHNNAELQAELDTQLLEISTDKKLIVITCHRRENFGEGFLKICHALRELVNNPSLQRI